MAAATGNIVIALAGGSFDSATYPRFVLNDGTNSLTFVIDNNAASLSLDGSQFEDNRPGELHVPTLDEADGARKARIAMSFQKMGLWDDDKSGNTDPRMTVTDVSGTTITFRWKHGVNMSADSSTYGSLIAGTAGSSKNNVYRKSATEYWINQKNTSDSNATHNLLFYWAIKYAYANDSFGVRPYIVTNSSGGTAEPAVGSTSSNYYSILLESTANDFEGNACNVKVLGEVTSGSNLSTGYGDSGASVTFLYEEWQNASYAAYNHAARAQLYGVTAGAFFKNGTIAGSSSDAALTTANIAEAIKDMINSSVLEITATRSDSTVSLTNDNDGESGNVTITTTNEGSLFSVSGMSGGGASSGGSVMARSKLNPEQLSKLDINNGALAKAIDLTGSAKHSTAIVAADSFLIQPAAGGPAQHCSASLMQDFFSKVDVTASSGGGTHRLVFVDPAAGALSGADLAIDDGTLTYVPSSMTLTNDGPVSGAAGSFDAITGVSLALQGGGITAAGAIAGATTIAASSNATVEGIVSGAAGTFDALGGTSLALQGGGITAAGAIAGATTITLSGELDAGSLDVSAGADIAGAVALGAPGGSADTTVRGDLQINENLSVQGNLTIHGATTTVDSSNLVVEDALIALGISSGSAGAANDRGLVFSLASAKDQLIFWDNSASTFVLGSALANGALPQTASVVQVGDHSNLRLGALTADDASTFTAGASMNNAGITNAGAIAGATTIAASSNATIEGIVSGAAGTFDALGGTSLALQGGGITAAGAIAGATTIAASSNATVEGIVSGAAGTFDALGGTSLALQGGGITAAGAIAGATTIAASSNATVEGIVSGAAGTFDALGGTSLALQGGGITAAGAIAGATTIDASGDLTVGSITNAEFTVDASGNTDIDGTLNVEGVPTFQAGAVFSGGVTTANAIAGATTISGSGLVSAGGGLAVQDKYTVSTAGAVSASSTLQVGGTVRLDGAAEVVADIDADYLYFKDATDNLVKRDKISDVLALAKGDGIQVAATGLISISYELQHFSGSTGSAGLFPTCSTNTRPGNFARTGSYSGLFAPLDEEIVVGSLQVYLNGMLQVKSGSVHGTHDYELLNSGSTANKMIKFADEPEEDDAIVIQYIKK